MDNAFAHPLKNDELLQ